MFGVGTGAAVSGRFRHSSRRHLSYRWERGDRPVAKRDGAVRMSLRRKDDFLTQFLMEKPTGHS